VLAEIHGEGLTLMPGAYKTVQVRLLLKSTREKGSFAKISHQHEGIRQIYLELRENFFQEWVERPDLNWKNYYHHQFAP